MATKNSINNASANLTIDPGVSGDSYAQFGINGTGLFTVGVDDSDGNSFKLSQGSSLGTNDRIKIDTDGIVTVPANPVFLAQVDGIVNNVTGDGSSYDIIFDQQNVDTGSNYDPVTGIFEAPIEGRYYLCSGISFSSVDASHTRGTVIINTSNGLFYLNDIDVGNWKASTSRFRISQGIFADMDAMDTAYVSVMVSGSTKVVDIEGSTTIRYSFFGGYLAC